MPATSHVLPRTSRLCAGFTAIELLMALAVAAILAAIAMPSFGGVIERYKLRRTSDEMTSAIYLARAEALKRGGNITLRKASSPGCAGKEVADWSCGWRVLADVDIDGAVGPGEQTIQFWPAPDRVEVTMRAAQAQSQFKLNRWGRFGNTQGFSVTLRSAGSKGKSAAVVLCMSAGGRLQTFQQAERCPD